MLIFQRTFIHVRKLDQDISSFVKCLLCVLYVKVPSSSGKEYL